MPPRKKARIVDPAAACDGFKMPAADSGDPGAFFTHMAHLAEEIGLIVDTCKPIYNLLFDAL